MGKNELVKLEEPSEEMVHKRLKDYCRDKGIDYESQPEKIKARLKKMAYEYCYHELNMAWIDDPSIFYEIGADKDTWRKVYQRLRSIPGRENLSKDDFALEYFTDYLGWRYPISSSSRDERRNFVKQFVVTDDNPYTGYMSLAHMEFPYLDDFIAEDTLAKNR